MSDQSRTRTPIKDIIADIQTKLAAYDGWSLAEHKCMDISNLFSYLPSLQCPGCVVLHANTDYTNPEIDRVLDFWVVIITRNMGDDPAASDEAQTLIEKTMELLDNQINETLDIHYVILRDEAMDQPNFSKVIYKVVLRAYDH